MQRVRRGYVDLPVQEVLELESTSSEIQDISIRTAPEVSHPDMRGVWIQVSEVRDEPLREVLVEEELQACSRAGGVASGAGKARQAPLPLRGKRETGADVLAFELGEVSEDLVLTHPSGQIGEHVADGGSGAPHCGLSEPTFKIQDNAVTIVHE